MSNCTIINPDYVKSLTKFTDNFLCELDDNKYIKFSKISLRTISYRGENILLRLELNINSNNINDEVIKKSKDIKDIYKNPRMIRFHLKKDIIDNNLKLSIKYKNICKTGFVLKMIEKHYFHNDLIFSLEQNLGFCVQIQKIILN